MKKAEEDLNKIKKTAEESNKNMKDKDQVGIKKDYKRCLGHHSLTVNLVLTPNFLEFIGHIFSPFV